MKKKESDIKLRTPLYTKSCYIMPFRIDMRDRLQIDFLFFIPCKLNLDAKNTATTFKYF